MAQEIQQAIIRIRLQDAQTPLDIAAQVAPNLSSLETTQQDLQDHHETDLEWLQINATMLADTSIDQTQHHITSEQAQNIADESLSWTQASITTMTDTQYYQNLNRASSDQRLVIDRVYRHNRSLIQGQNPDQLLLFVTGGAGVGKSFLIQTIQEMLIRMQHHNPVLLTAPTGIAAYNIGGVTIHSAFVYQLNITKQQTMSL